MSQTRGLVNYWVLGIIECALELYRPTDVQTRWNSTFDMFQRILEQQQAIIAVLLESKKSSDQNLILTGSEVTKIENLTVVLKPLSQATTMLCEEKYPSLSLVQPVISIVLKHYLLVSEGDVMDIVHCCNFNVINFIYLQLPPKK